MTTMEERKEEEISTEYCNNCKRDIPSVNYVMHTSHCSRNIMLCDLCNEAVPISEKDEHFEENHAKVKCECGESFEKMDLETHKERDCTHRKVVCEYCELELPFSEMKSHKDFCGSRTELCEKCSKYVQHKDLAVHLNSDCQAELPSRQNNAAASTMQSVGRNRIPLDEFIHNVDNVDYGDGYDFEVNALQRLLQATSQGGLFGAGDVNEHRSFHGTRNMFPQPTRDVVARGLTLNSQPTRPRRNRHSDDFDNSVYEDEIPRGNQLETDELMAALLACENEYPERGLNNQASKSRRNRHSGDFDNSVYEDEIHRGDQLEGDELMAALLASQDNYSGGGLNNQENRSSRKRYSGDFDNSIYEDEIHRRNQLEDDELMAAFLASEDDNKGFDHQPFSSERDLLQRQNSFDCDTESRYNHHESALDQTVLPCEFCGEAIQAQDLILHQTGCQLTTMGASNTPSSGGYPNLRSQPRSLPPLHRESPQDDFQRLIESDDNDETLLPCEFCDEPIHPDFLFSHQSMCDPQRTRPSSVLQTEHFYGSQPERHLSNNARPRVSNIPPRPSRPVVNKRLEDKTIDESLNKGPATVSASVRNDNRSYIARSDKSDQRRQSPWQRNDKRETNGTGAYSNDSPLTVIKRNSMKNSKKEGLRYSSPELALDENKVNYENALQRKSSSSGSREKLTGFTGPERTKWYPLAQEADHIEKMASSKTPSYGSKAESKRNLGKPADFSPHHRSSKREPLAPRSDKNKSTASKTSTKKKGFPNSVKKSELAPCFDVKPLSSNGSSRNDRPPSQPRRERNVKNSTSDRGGAAAPNEKRDASNTESKPRRSKKKFA